MTQDNLSITSTLRVAWVLLAFCLCLLASCGSSDDDDDATPTKDKSDTTTTKDNNQTFTVTFDLNGGTDTAPNPQTITKDGNATEPAAPTRDGYIFKGWYTQQNGSGPAFAFDTTPITANITLYAVWTLVYSITLAGTEYAGIADDTNQTILVNIGKVYKTINGQTVQLVVTDDAGTTVVDKSVTLTQAKATIDVTRDGKTYTTLKLFVKPSTNTELIAIVNAAIDTTNGEGDTANLNFVDTSDITDMGEVFASKTTFNGDLSEWDTANVTYMGGMFSSADAFNQNIGNWDTANVTSMYAMFNDAKAFNQDIGRWKTANVTYMGGMFYGTDAFNQDISQWKTGKVTNMSYMFNNAKAFNQDISQWDTAKVTDMSNMFNNAEVFNQDIGRWKTAKVTTMNGMFNNAKAFNQDIGQWKTGEVTTMSGMFNNAKAFNQDIGRWDTAKVTDMSYMFQGAQAFNQDLSDWNVAKVVNHESIFVGSAMADKTDQYPDFPTAYTVTFDTDDGTYLLPIGVLAKGMATKPKDPTKDGSTFGGWYTDAARTKEFVFTTPITADITLYAKWN